MLTDFTVESSMSIVKMSKLPELCYRRTGGVEAGIWQRASFTANSNKITAIAKMGI